MGNTVTVCIHQALEKQSIQVVLPDGQVLCVSEPLTALRLVESHPDPKCIVCHGSPLLEQRVPLSTKLENGEIYFLVPCSDLRMEPEKPVTKPVDRPVDEKPRRQQCLINLLLLSQNVASIIDSGDGQILGTDSASAHRRSECVKRTGSEMHFSRHNRGRSKISRMIKWKPDLPTISENRSWPRPDNSHGLAAGSAPTIRRNSLKQELSAPARVPSAPPQVPSSPSRLIVGPPRSPARLQHEPPHFPSPRFSPSPLNFPSPRFPPSPLHFSSPRFPPSPLHFFGSPSVRGPASPSFQSQSFVYSA